MKSKQIKQLVILGLCIALSYIGSYIKISGTIALDALPAFFAAILLGPFIGGAVGFVGHMLTALLSGFPLSFPIHLVVAIMMFFSCAIFGYVYKKVNPILGIIAGVVMNGPVSLAVAAAVVDLLVAKGAGLGMFMGMIIVLTIGAAINVILGSAIYMATKKYIQI